VSSQEVAVNNTTSQQGEVLISCTPDLYLLTMKWASEYGSLNPQMKIKVIKNVGANSVLSAGENISFISKISGAAGINEANWKMVVGRNVVVPVINAGNPYLNELMVHGISQETFARVFRNPDKQNWGYVLGNGQNSPMHIYLINDESVKESVEKFLQSAQFPTEGIVVQSKEEVIMALQNDPYAIGFCKVVNIQGMDNQGLTGNLKLLPIDKNGNGTIDYMEDIYGDVNTLLRGVWIGKYPKTLYSNIYAVSKMAPKTEAEIAFLSWVLTDGQQYMNANGYCDLASSESQSQLAKFNAAAINIQPRGEASNAGLILLIAAMFITIGVIVSVAVRRFRKEAPAIPDFNDSLSGFNENTVEVPKGIYFNKSHSWAFMEKDGTVSIGIDDFLQHVTGPLTRVEMRNPGEKVKKGEFLFSIIQSGKRLSLYSPISGNIKKHNEALIDDASLINASPYIDGWIYRIEPSNWFVEVNFMDMADKYKKWINTEFSRMKDFLAATLKPDSLKYSHVVLQDGGIVKEGVLADFGPEVWDDFQTNFLEIYK
jgi:glycine cleavage system H lipoate-binding protein/ABC-type phosphate transport system substrate-binding protein